MVMIDQPIRKSMNKLEVVGRMLQWAVELSQFDIKYHPKTAIKVQALVNFVAEFTIPNEKEILDESKSWTIQTNGSSARKRGGIGVIIITPEGDVPG